MEEGIVVAAIAAAAAAVVRIAAPQRVLPAAEATQVARTNDLALGDSSACGDGGKVAVFAAAEMAEARTEVAVTVAVWAELVAAPSGNSSRQWLASRQRLAEQQQQLLEQRKTS